MATLSGKNTRDPSTPFASLWPGRLAAFEAAGDCLGSNLSLQFMSLLKANVMKDTVIDGGGTYYSLSGIFMVKLLLCT